MRVRSFPYFIPFYLILFFLLLFAGCSHELVVENQDSIILTNRGARPIHTLLIKPCNQPYEELTEMASNIKPGATKLIPLYPGCFDADALDENGELMATQYKLRLPPQLRWDVY